MTASISSRKKEELANMVRELGGVLLSTCSASEPPHILLANDVTSDRYIEVLSLAKTPVLKTEWISACYKAGRQLPYEGFRVPPLAGLVICVTGLDQARRPALQATVEGAGGIYSKDLKQNVTHLIAVSANSDKFKMANSWPNTHVVSFQWLHDSLVAKARQNESKFPVQSKALQKANRVQITSDKQHSENKQQQKSTCSLNGLRLYCLGMDKDELLKAKKLTRKLGATRYSKFSNCMTHIVCGENGDIDNEALTSIEPHVFGGPGVLVTLRWLEDCLREQSAVKANGSASIIFNDLKRRCSKNPILGIHEDTQAIGQKEDCRRVCDGLFSNKSFGFCMLGLSERKEACELIEREGGQCRERDFDSTLIMEEVDFLVLPSKFDMQSKILGRVKGEYVTLYWLQKCIQSQSLLASDSCILFQPLSESLPLPAFSKVNICVSQYSDREREIISILTTYLGGQYSQDDTLRKAKTTHLVLPKAHGKKWEKCKAWKIQPVTAQWLIDCSRKGTILPETSYRPEKPTPPDVPVVTQQNNLEKPHRNSYSQGLRRQSSTQGHSKVSSHTTGKTAGKVHSRGQRSRSSKACKEPKVISPNAIISQSTPAQEVISALDRIEGLFKNTRDHGKMNILRSNGRIKQSRENIEQKNVTDYEAGLQIFEDSMEDYGASQKVTYGDEDFTKGRKRTRMSVNYVSEQDFAKKLLCKAVSSNQGQTKKADELKKLDLI